MNQNHHRIKITRHWGNLIVSCVRQKKYIVCVKLPFWSFFLNSQYLQYLMCCTFLRIEIEKRDLGHMVLQLKPHLTATTARSCPGISASSHPVVGVMPFSQPLSLLHIVNRKKRNIIADTSNGYRYRYPDWADHSVNPNRTCAWQFGSSQVVMFETNPFLDSIWTDNTFATLRDPTFRRSEMLLTFL